MATAIPDPGPSRRVFAGLGLAAVLAVTGTACAPEKTSTDTTAPEQRPAPENSSIPAKTKTASGISLSLPAPSGKYPIGTVDLHLVDRSRRDPLKPSKPHRELMISLWYPAERAENRPVAPWMSAGAAADWDQHSAPGLGIPAGAVDWAATSTHARVNAPVNRDAGNLPVLLFSSGDGGVRTLGTTLVEELASRGYLVLTVDHTYEADQVEFPGGRVERAVPLPAKLTESVIAKLLRKHSKARVADVTFVLDRLADLDYGRSPDADGKSLPAGLRGAVNRSRIGLLGQSLGGSVAAQVAHDDARVDAAVNLDSEFVGRVARTGVATPFLLVGSALHTRDNQPSWKSFWTNSTGWKRQLSFAGAAHASFTDLQVVFPQLIGRVKDLPVTDLIGTIDPQQSVSAQRGYVSAFFDLHLLGRPTGLFTGPSDQYPDVKLVP